MDELRSSARFFDEEGANYWVELAGEEKRLGRRFIGSIDGTHWLASFVSLGLLGEILCVFPDTFSVGDFACRHQDALVAGLIKVFRYFIAEGIGSFNASLSFGPPGQSFFSTHFRIVPRTFLNLRDYASDFNFFQAVLGEPVSVVMPEALAGDVRKFFT